MSSVATAMTTQLTSMVSSLETALADVAPLAIPIVGIGLVVILGIKLFKRVAANA